MYQLKNPRIRLPGTQGELRLDLELLLIQLEIDMKSIIIRRRT